MTSRELAMLELKLLSVRASAEKVLLAVESSGRPASPRAQAYAADGQLVLAGIRHALDRERLRRATTF